MPGLLAIAACVVAPSSGERQLRPAAEKDVFAARRHDARRAGEGLERDAGTEAEHVQHFRRQRRIGVLFFNAGEGEKSERVADFVQSGRVKIKSLGPDAVARIEVEALSRIEE